MRWAVASTRCAQCGAPATQVIQDGDRRFHLCARTLCRVLLDQARAEQEAQR